MKAVRDWMIILFLFAIMAPSCTGDYDDTDDAANKHHSGVRLITDHGTGCQYLLSTLSGMTPRLDGTGKPMCGKVEK